MFHVHLERLYVVEWNILKRSISSSCLIVLFESSVSLLLCAYSCYHLLRVVLKSLTMLVDLSISSCSSPSFCFMYLKLYNYMHKCVGLFILFINWHLYHYEVSFVIAGNIFVLKNTLSDNNTATPAVFWLVLAWYIIFHSITLNLFVSSLLKCVSCGHHTIGSYLYYASEQSLPFNWNFLDHLYLGWLWIWLGLNLSSCSLFSICFIWPLLLFFLSSVGFFKNMLYDFILLPLLAY